MTPGHDQQTLDRIETVIRFILALHHIGSVDLMREIARRWPDLTMREFSTAFAVANDLLHRRGHA